MNSLPSAVKNSGAVSPAARAIASMEPVVSPAAALGSTTFRTVRHFGVPRASEASRTLVGTRPSISSEVLSTIGHMMSPRANAPARAEKWCTYTTMRP